MPPQMTNSPIIKYLLQLVFVTSTYVLTGKFGLLVPYIGSHITLIWLPTGIAVAALFIGGYRLWPAIFVGAGLVNLLVGSSLLLALMVAVGNTLGPLLTYYIMRTFKLDAIFNRGKDVTILVFSTALGMTLSASGGVLSLVRMGVVDQTQAVSSWLVWWAGDTVGVLLSLPILLSITAKSLKLLWQHKKQYLGVCMMISVLEVIILVFVRNPAGQYSLLAFVVLPLIVWLVIRFGLVGSGIAVFGLSAIAVLATVNAQGPFYQANMHQGIISLWVFMCVLSLTALVINISQMERLNFEEALIASETKLRAVINGALDAIVTIDEAGRIIEFNAAAERIFAYKREQVMGKTLDQVMIPPASRQAHKAGHHHFINTGEKRIFDQRLELTAMRSDGSEFPVELTLTSLKDQGLPLVTGFIRDITKRKRAEEEIQKLAFYEVLTGLPNRRLLLDRIEQAFAHSARSQHHGAVLFVDLDNFKSLNDSRGHEVGDSLLIEVAHRIKECVREMDTVSRLGGDEFVVLLEELSVEQALAAVQAKQLAEKLLDIISKPYDLHGLEHHTSSSIGVCLFIGREIALDELLKRADTAMYQAKASGRNTLRFFDPSMQQALQNRVVMESQMRHALELNEFSLRYQIQVDSNRYISGAEVLLRWNNPQLGAVRPIEFIPIAEETGQILAIGAWVLECACKQLSYWQKTYYADQIKLSVNVSARQFKYDGFVDMVKHILEKTGANPALLKLELTESMVIEDVVNSIQTMQQLKALGLSFSLDDFGTGYSSLAYLKQLPLTQIKIDQSFVRDLVTDPSDAAIVNAIIVMSQALGFEVIAEGVETLAQFNMLRDYGCRQFQGYFFGQPILAEELDELIKANKLQIASVSMENGPVAIDNNDLAN